MGSMSGRQVTRVCVVFFHSAPFLDLLDEVHSFKHGAQNLSTSPKLIALFSRLMPPQKASYLVSRYQHFYISKQNIFGSIFHLFVQFAKLKHKMQMHNLSHLVGLMYILPYKQLSSWFSIRKKGSICRPILKETQNAAK